MLKKPLEMAKEIIESHVAEGDTVVDATLGNGHDALFLGKCVGDLGKVIGFDVQQEAVDSAVKRLKSSGLNWFEFHCCGHEKMKEHVSDELSAVMFNLGYLPRADKAIITTAETTIPALEQATELLKEGGIVSIMCYPGHEGGDVESEAVRKWASELKRESFRVMEYGYVNAPNNPAFLILLEKLG